MIPDENMPSWTDRNVGYCCFAWAIALVVVFVLAVMYP